MRAPSPGQPNTRQQQAAARRQQILEVAIRLFAQHGVARTTTRQIAQAAGIAEGLIFKYFPTKLDLVRAVVDTPHVFTSDLRHVLEAADTQPLDEVMRQIATRWLGLLQREADLSTILFGEALINPEIGAVHRQVIEAGSEGMSRFLEARKQQGQLSPAVDTKTAVHMYMSSLLMFFVRYRHLSAEAWARESASFAEQLTLAWLRMVVP